MTSRNHRRVKRDKAFRNRQIRIRLSMLAIALVFGSVLFMGSTSLHAEAMNTTEETEYKYYANIDIRYGDTLWSIADTYMSSNHYASKNAYIQEVRSINHLKGDDLMAGTHLIVPYYSSEWK